MAEGENMRICRSPIFGTIPLNKSFKCLLMEKKKCFNVKASGIFEGPRNVSCFTSLRSVFLTKYSLPHEDDNDKNEDGEKNGTQHYHSRCLERWTAAVARVDQLEK